MKKTAYYYLSLAAIVAGSLVSCQDDDRGFTSEEVKASVYEREFIKAFGQPAANHAWGFDAKPFAIYDLDYVNSTTPSTRANIDVFDSETYLKKYDQEWANGIDIRNCLELPPIISDDEHEEVSAWFRNHIVYWADSLTTAENDKSREFRSDKGAIAYERDRDFNYGSLSAYSGNVDVVTSFMVNWAFVQHVSRDTQIEGFQSDEHCWDQNGIIDPITRQKGSIPQSQNAGWWVPNNGNGGQMNHLSIKLTGGSQYLHLKDFNTGGMCGWPCTDDQSDNNGDLVFNADFNDMVYLSSADSKYHNKYIIVYLKGETRAGVPYEGYYLGMDLEGGGQNDNELVPANGVCDDWIVKLTIPTAKIVQGEPRRIMCEDLGGVYDYDFNDIVIDVTPKVSVHDNSGRRDVNYLEVKLQALGGTLPIYVTYEGHALWGSTEQDLHELFRKGAGYPVNVSNGVDNSHNGAYTADPLVAKVIKTSDKKDSYSGYTVDLTGAIETDSDIDYKKIHIYIKPSSEAEWIQLANYAGIAPLKIIVPQTVGWTIECAGMPGTETSPKSTEAYESLSSGRSMGCAYPDFMGWVNDPSALFWDRTIVTDYIYHQ